MYYQHTYVQFKMHTDMTILNDTYIIKLCIINNYVYYSIQITRVSNCVQRHCAGTNHFNLDWDFSVNSSSIYLIISDMLFLQEDVEMEQLSASFFIHWLQISHLWLLSHGCFADVLSPCWSFQMMCVSPLMGYVELWWLVDWKCCSCGPVSSLLTHSLQCSKLTHHMMILWPSYWS